MRVRYSNRAKKLLRRFGDFRKLRAGYLPGTHNTVRYFAGSREFEIAELKLLVDAIQSSKFITRSKSLRLIEKLEGLVSENEGRLLHREVVVTNRVKTLNERIYYNVDFLHNAISQGKKVSFKYMEWRVNFGDDKKIVRSERKNGESYVVSPWALCWDDENYYLVAYDAPQARSSTTASIRWKRSFAQRQPDGEEDL